MRRGAIKRFSKAWARQSGLDSGRSLSYVRHMFPKDNIQHGSRGNETPMV
jgi:hypothetical protein